MISVADPLTGLRAPQALGKHPGPLNLVPPGRYPPGSFLPCPDTSFLLVQMEGCKKQWAWGILSRWNIDQWKENVEEMFSRWIC